jgi:arylsulfatase A
LIRVVFYLPIALLTLMSLSATPAVFSAALTENSANASYPNIVLILADDLGYGDIEIYNPDGKIATPRLNDLALQGMHFTDAHSGAAVCSPTRYGLLTGQHFQRRPWESIRLQLGKSMIDEDRLTLPAMLQKRGYHTGAFGKWHLGQTFYKSDGTPARMPNRNVDWMYPMTGGPNDRGFDTYFGVPFGQATWLYAFVSNRLVTEVPSIMTRQKRLKAAGYSPELAMPEVTRKVLDYIDWNVAERPGQPFFAYFALPAIHVPLVPSPEFVGKSRAGVYGDFVMQVDAAVGSVIDRLARHKLDDNTLVIFSSDNGSHGMAGNEAKKSPPGSVYQRFGHKMNGDLRGLKGQLYEGGHRVPFIVRWPGVVEPRTVSTRLFMLEDLMATIASIVNVDLPPGSAEDSYNLLSYLDGSHAGPPIRQYAVFTTFDGDPVVRQGDWVLSFQTGTGKKPKGSPAKVHLFPFLDTRVDKPDERQYAIFRTLEKRPATGPGAWLQDLEIGDGKAAHAGSLSRLQTEVAQGQLYNLRTDPQQLKNVWLEYPDVVKDLTFLYAAHVSRGSSFYVDR